MPRRGLNLQTTSARDEDRADGVLFRGEIFTADGRLQDLEGLGFFTSKGKETPCCGVRREATHEVIQLYGWAIPVQLGILLRQLRRMRGICLIKAQGLGLRLLVT